MGARCGRMARRRRGIPVRISCGSESAPTRSSTETGPAGPLGRAAAPWWARDISRTRLQRGAAALVELDRASFAEVVRAARHRWDAAGPVAAVAAQVRVRGLTPGRDLPARVRNALTDGRRRPPPTSNVARAPGPTAGLDSRGVPPPLRGHRPRPQRPRRHRARKDYRDVLYYSGDY
ncbi:hypothetical protein FRACA_4110003 [Frankia canadensis]|uniref:Uncharacterized protein n=1 Tax=Frankia canadensis TaxID=1836972 RepID=A0A2I2KWX3_9ACTN|nr:hypothetical protein FRACA_4110003 [Frankia canadensis]SOU57467.1 hypothetical protein FRACA_4110003 [Frankia canadensis]